MTGAEAQRPCHGLLTQGVDSGSEAVLGENHSNLTPHDQDQLA